MSKVSRFLLLVFTFSLFGSCLIGAIWLYNLDAASANQGEEHAIELITALERYKQDNAIYPANLNELVPNYLVAVSRPTWRHEYYYRVFPSANNPQTYELAFILQSSTDDWDCYDSKDRKWERRDSIC